jgi:hypothetical protein
MLPKKNAFSTRFGFDGESFLPRQVVSSTSSGHQASRESTNPQASEEALRKVESRLKGRLLPLPAIPFRGKEKRARLVSYPATWCRCPFESPEGYPSGWRQWLSITEVVTSQHATKMHRKPLCLTNSPKRAVQQPGNR